MELISVIVPTYNVEEYIKETINSVIDQDYKELEIVVVDDGSTDNTKSIIRELALSNDISLIELEHTANVGANLNYGIQHAKGDIIAILGADDLWAGNKLSSQIKFLEKFKIICSNGNIINGKGEVVREAYIEDIKKDVLIDLALLLTKNYVIASSVVGYKNLFKIGGGFESELGRRGEDYYLWLNIAEKTPFYFCNDKLVSYRKHGKNLSTANINEKIKLWENTVKIQSKYLNDNDENIHNASVIGICEFLKELCKLYRSIKDYVSAYECSKKFLKLYPRFDTLFVKVFLFKIYCGLKK